MNQLQVEEISVSGNLGNIIIIYRFGNCRIDFMPKYVIHSIMESSELRFIGDIESILWRISPAVPLGADVDEGTDNKSIGKLKVQQIYYSNRNNE